MNKKGPIVIIEDDEDDRAFIEDAFKEINCGNKLIMLPNGTQALEYLKHPDVKPFLVLSDINMPVMDGFALRNVVHEDSELAAKCIPYVFFSTTATNDAVKRAYNLSVQGYFKKPNSFPDMVRTLRSIVDYWQHCCSPGSSGRLKSRHSKLAF